MASVDGTHLRSDGKSMQEVQVQSIIRCTEHNYLYMKRLMLILGVFSNGLSITSTFWSWL